MLDRLFNWKKYPSSVFWIALPLAIIGFGTMAATAILQLKLHGDPVYLIIWVAAVIVLCVGLWPVRKLLR